LCRFSDAGSDKPSTGSGERRLKSAKARNRGKWGHCRCRGPSIVITAGVWRDAVDQQRARAIFAEIRKSVERGPAFYRRAQREWYEIARRHA
jgi:hypothetical protein